MMTHFAAMVSDDRSFDLLLAALFALLALAAVLAQRSRIPYPIFLVLAGTVLGYVPNVPRLELEPDLVFTIFLPPLIYGSAYFTSMRELVLNRRPIGRLAIGLVFYTLAWWTMRRMQVKT